jgi:hypothetical protein
VIRAMLQHRPSIVHFAGHSRASGGIMLGTHTGESRIATGEMLAELFRVFEGTVQCVVLNSCWAATQALAIARHVPYVVGTKPGVSDDAGLAFSRAFYEAVAARRDIPFAFRIGEARMRMQGDEGQFGPFLTMPPLTGRDPE